MSSPFSDSPQDTLSTPSALGGSGLSGPDFFHESILTQQGKIVCGCDEAGRGPLAGPVTAAAVVLNVDRIPEGLNDSKKLTEAKRETLFRALIEGHHVAWVSLNAEAIDQMNIRAASLKAMAIAVADLPKEADHALIDGNALPDNLNCEATALVKGDGRSLSIAAASIVAKVIRDRQMMQAHRLYPQYGFDRHKGYPSAQHRQTLMEIGPCPLHRKTFKPVRLAIEKWKTHGAKTNQI